jgi:hypothetical protein
MNSSTLPATDVGISNVSNIGKILVSSKTIRFQEKKNYEALYKYK